MNIRSFCPVLPCILRGPRDGASPLWKKEGIAHTTSARGEPLCKHCRAMTFGPVIPTPWINSRPCCGSGATRTSPSRLLPRLHSRGIDALSRRRVQRWATHWPASIALCPRSRSQGSGTIASCGAQRPLPVRWDQCGSSGAGIGPRRAILRCALWGTARRDPRGHLDPVRGKAGHLGRGACAPQRGGSTLCPVGEQDPIEQSARSLAHSAECLRGDAPSTL